MNRNGVEVLISSMHRNSALDIRVESFSIYPNWTETVIGIVLGILSLLERFANGKTYSDDGEKTLILFKVDSRTTWPALDM